MELRHLRYFVAVAEEENVTRAALKLHVSQPGVSRQIRDLEQEIGFPLFERSAKAVKLTDAGRVFLTEARAVLQRAVEAVNSARSVAGGVTGEINVGYAPSLTVQILPRTLRAFQEKFPRVRVALHDLSTEEMLTQLRQDRLQVALTVRLPPRLLRGLKQAELAQYSVRVGVAANHPLGQSKFVTLEQFAGEPLIGYSRKEYPEYHKFVEKLFAPLGRAPRLAGEYDGISSLAAAVEAGRGFALLPECVACLVGPRLKLLSLRPALTPICVVALWRAQSESESLRNFIAAAGPASEK